MQVRQIPLTLLGIESFQYSKNDISNVVYDPKRQVSNLLYSSQGGRDTVSDCATYSGIFGGRDDEERDTDD